MSLLKKFANNVGTLVQKGVQWVQDDFEEGMRIAEIPNPLHAAAEQDASKPQNTFKVKPPGK